MQVSKQTIISNFIAKHFAQNYFLCFFFFGSIPSPIILLTKCYIFSISNHFVCKSIKIHVSHLRFCNIIATRTHEFIM